MTKSEAPRLGLLAAEPVLAIDGVEAARDDRSRRRSRSSMRAAGRRSASRAAPTRAIGHSRTARPPAPARSAATRSGRSGPFRRSRRARAGSARSGRHAPGEEGHQQAGDREREQAEPQDDRLGPFGPADLADGDGDDSAPEGGEAGEKPARSRQVAASGRITTSTPTKPSATALQRCRRPLASAPGPTAHREQGRGEADRRRFGQRQIGEGAEGEQHRRQADAGAPEHGRAAAGSATRRNCGSAIHSSKGGRPKAKR
jgi:hypothetical protein